MTSVLAEAGSRGPVTAWRRWRGSLLIAALVLLGGVAVAMLKPVAGPAGYLDPAGTDQFGSHALADILAARGHPVVSSYSAPAALAAARQGDATVVITNPDALAAAALTRLAAAPADIMLVGPGRHALAAVAPAIRLAAGTSAVDVLLPRCPLGAARLAGDAAVGGISYDISRAPAGTVGCYPVGGHPSLVRYSIAGRAVIILGSGAPLANESLAGRGNAALAINLLSGRHRVIWLTPPPGAAGSAPAGRPASVFSLIPAGAYLVALQLGVAVVLAALWRSRRLGALVPERLPVVVRASETVQGHARLYQARRARDRAAAALRDALLARVLPALGLVRDAPQDAVTAALGGRSAIAGQEIARRLYGPPPASDAALVALAADLDELERQVRGS